MIEKTLYNIIGNLSNANVPLVFKGALITKLILSEQGYNQMNRGTKDIDANWVGKPPSMSELVSVINANLGELSSSCVAEANREYSKNQSAGIVIKDKNTGDKLLSMDIDIKPLIESKMYYYGETSIRGVLPNEILTDKISAISSDAVFKHRAKDLIDIFALSHCVEIKTNEIFDMANKTSRTIYDFDGFYNRRDDVAHAYSRLKGVEGKPLFDELYKYLKNFIEPFAEKNYEAKTWDCNSQLWNIEKVLSHSMSEYKSLIAERKAEASAKSKSKDREREKTTKDRNE